MAQIAAALSETRPGAPFGSSYAVTSDSTDRDKRWLWLSEASHITLREGYPEILTRNHGTEPGNAVPD